jgi:predicted NAD/FAD-dependent oxidoreductase
VAIIGAGISGLVAARELAGAGHEVVVFEKSRGLGGRMAARRAEGGAVLDHGLPMLDAPPGGVLAKYIVEFAADDVVEVEAPGDPVPGRAIEGAPRLGWPAGMTRLPKAMADGLQVVTDVRVAGIRADGDLLELAQDQGNTLGLYDWVIITAPGAQAADLLDSSPRGAVRAADVRAVQYDVAVMVLAGVAMDPPGWFAHRPLTGPITYITNEVAKGREPVDGVVPLVVRLDPEVSDRLMEESDRVVLAEVLPALAKVLGKQASSPVWSQVKRWRYSTTRGRLDQEALNPDWTRVLLAGDAVAAGPHMEDVAATGLWAARRILDS